MDSCAKACYYGRDYDFQVQGEKEVEGLEHATRGKTEVEGQEHTTQSTTSGGAKSTPPMARCQEERHFQGKKRNKGTKRKQWWTERKAARRKGRHHPEVSMQEISSDDDVGQQSVWRPGQAASSGDKREIAPPDSPLHEELKVVIPAPEMPPDGNLHEELKEGIPAPETPSEAFAPAPLAKRSRAFVPAKPTSKRLPQDMRLRKESVSGWQVRQVCEASVGSVQAQRMCKHMLLQMLLQDMLVEHFPWCRICGITAEQNLAMQHDSSCWT
jgi:hypothetical protein